MTRSKKIILLLAAQLIVCSSMHAMHRDDKSEAEQAMHRDDKTKEDCKAREDAQVKADHIAKLQAQAQGAVEKPAQADDQGSLGALGDPTRKPLTALRDADNKNYPIKIALLALAKDKEAQKDLGFDTFGALPFDLQQKIIRQYYDRAIVRYVLRHKREFAPLIISLPRTITMPDEKGTKVSIINAEDLLGMIDGWIITLKYVYKEAITSERKSDLNLGRYILMNAILNEDAQSFNFRDMFNVLEKPSMLPGEIGLTGYLDRTYTLNLNYGDLKNLMDSYSLEQLTFFVSLAKIKNPNERMPKSCLSSKDCVLFASLDAATQSKLQQVYPWIDFYTPNNDMMRLGDQDVDFSTLSNAQIKEISESYSVEQLVFIGFLYKMDKPESFSIANVQLSTTDCALFKSFNAQTQSELKAEYPWIDFYTPNDRALSIDDRIQRAQDKFFDLVAYLEQCALNFFCPKRQ